MFLSTLQFLLQSLYPGATCRIIESSLYLEHENFVGSVKVSDRGSYAFFDQIFVANSKQRQSIGSQVLGAIETACKANNLTYIECYPTQGGALSGVSFFTKKGFTCPAGAGNWRKNV